MDRGGRKVNATYQLNRPSAVPLAQAGAAPSDDQEGIKKQPVEAFIDVQSAAAAGPSKVDTRG